MIDRTRSSPNRNDLDEIEEIAPDSKHGEEGQAAHGGDQAGPNSDEAGKPLSPQTGDPHDRAH